jgi:hypothetical protein
VWGVLLKDEKNGEEKRKVEIMGELKRNAVI